MKYLEIENTNNKLISLLADQLSEKRELKRFIDGTSPYLNSIKERVELMLDDDNEEMSCTMLVKDDDTVTFAHYESNSTFQMTKQQILWAAKHLSK